MAKKNDNSTRAQVLALLAGTEFRNWKEASVALQNTKDRAGKSMSNIGNHHNRSVLMSYLKDQHGTGNTVDFAEWKETTAKAMDIEIGTLEAALRGLRQCFDLCKIPLVVETFGFTGVSRTRSGRSEVIVTDDELLEADDDMTLFGAPQQIHSVISTPRAPAGSGQPQLPATPAVQAEPVTNGKTQKSRK